MKVRLLLPLALILAMTVSGCNLFSSGDPNADSNDPQELLQDARAALSEDDPVQALEMLEKAKELAPEDPNIRYFHAVAVARANDIDYNTYIDLLQQNSNGASIVPGKSQPAALASGDTLELFDLTEAELANLLRVCYIIQLDLLPVVNGIVDGSITPADFAFGDDAFLSCAVSSLVTGFLVMLDQDHNVTNGFVLDPRLSIAKQGDSYEVLLRDDNLTEQQIREEVQRVIRAQYGLLEQGLVCLWYYYQLTVNGQIAAGNVPVPPAPMPNLSDDSVASEFFEVVYLGLEALYEYAWPTL